VADVRAVNEIATELDPVSLGSLSRVPVVWLLELLAGAVKLPDRLGVEPLEGLALACSRVTSALCGLRVARS
jgi:hypothetical protein